MMQECLPKTAVVFDLETTGLSPDRDAIIEIGALKIIDGVIQEAVCFESLVCPTDAMGKRILIHPASQRVHGITDRMVHAAPCIGEVLPQFVEFVGHLPVVAHNVSFDGRFMRANAGRLGLNWQPTEWCTVQLSKKVFPKERAHNLDALAGRLGLTFTGERHRSLADVRVTAQAYLLLQQRLSEII